MPRSSGNAERRRHGKPADDVPANSRRRLRATAPEYGVRSPRSTPPPLPACADSSLACGHPRAARPMRPGADRRREIIIFVTDPLGEMAARRLIAFGRGRPDLVTHRGAQLAAGAAADLAERMSEVTAVDDAEAAGDR